jgi:hypothetical protein
MCDGISDLDDRPTNEHDLDDRTYNTFVLKEHDEVFDLKLLVIWKSNSINLTLRPEKVLS